MVGAGLGFLWFNAYPAQVFMGDALWELDLSGKMKNRKIAEKLGGFFRQIRRQVSNAAGRTDEDDCPVGVVEFHTRVIEQEGKLRGTGRTEDRQSIRLCIGGKPVCPLRRSRTWHVLDDNCRLARQGSP